MTTIGVRVCLLSDGSSDQTLRHPLQWMIESLGGVQRSFQWAELRFARDPPRSLHARLSLTREQFQFDILCVHRDAERQSLAARCEEIDGALQGLGIANGVPVVPVHATEAWLLHDEGAIRSAAGNPHGKQSLGLPRIRDLERVADPKSHLLAALTAAVPDRPRDRARVQKRFGEMRMRVAELSRYETIADLPAVAALRARLISAFAQLAGAPATHEA